MRRVPRVVAAALLAVSLSNCDGGPSDAELQEALEEQRLEDMRRRDAEYEREERRLENNKRALDERSNIVRDWSLRESHCIREQPLLPGTQCTDTEYVVRTIDGDTLEIAATPLSPVESVRLLGIDAPEIHEGRECGGAAARQRVRQLLEYNAVKDEDGKKLRRTLGIPDGATEVLLHRPWEFPDRDRYGRLLREVYLIAPARKPRYPGQPEEINLAARLVQEGLAGYRDFAAEMGVHPAQYKRLGGRYGASTLPKLERRARHQGVGSWSACGWK